MRPGAAASACGHAGPWNRAATAPGPSWVTEIPYQVQKSRLIEQIAQLLEDKKLPLLADIRDESAEKREAGAGTEGRARSSPRC